MSLFTSNLFVVAGKSAHKNLTFTGSPKDIAVNYVWLRPLCEYWPDRIPSGFFLADTFLMMDLFMDGLLLLGPDPDKEYSRDEKIEMARDESRRITRLLGALRYLWRNGCWG